MHSQTTFEKSDAHTKAAMIVDGVNFLAISIGTNAAHLERLNNWLAELIANLNEGNKAVLPDSVRLLEKYDLFDLNSAKLADAFVSLAQKIELLSKHYPATNERTESTESI